MKFIKRYVGKKIKEAINQAELTQATFAEQMDVATSTVSQWVRGVCLPDDAREVQLFKVLGIDEQFFFNTNPAPKISMDQIDDIKRAIEGQTTPNLVNQVAKLEKMIEAQMFAFLREEKEKDEEIRKLREQVARLSAGQKPEKTYEEIKKEIEQKPEFIAAMAKLIETDYGANLETQEERDELVRAILPKINYNPKNKKSAG